MAGNEKFDKIAYKNEFIKKNYDRVSLIVPKGKKEVIKKHAVTVGESVNGFINRAIDETMKNDSKKD